MARVKPIGKPAEAALDKAISACLANGGRLLDDVLQVELQNPPCTKLILSMIAQEEFAKAFLLILVKEDTIPWSPQLFRALHDHACKQLVGILIDYLVPEWETIEQLKEVVSADVALDGRLPPAVASALNILRHEKMRRWESNNWDWAEPPEYDPEVTHIAKGSRDRLKQDALYVRLGRDGQVLSVPGEVISEDADAENKRAHRYRSSVESLSRQGDSRSAFYEKLQQGLKAIFKG